LKWVLRIILLFELFFHENSIPLVCGRLFVAVEVFISRRKHAILVKSVDKVSVVVVFFKYFLVVSWACKVDWYYYV